MMLMDIMISFLKRTKRPTVVRTGRHMFKQPKSG